MKPLAENQQLCDDVISVLAMTNSKEPRHSTIVSKDHTKKLVRKMGLPLGVQKDTFLV